eukprot:44199-Amphidinium_carterae.1
MPLFPSSRGSACTKAAVAETLVEIAARVGERLHDGMRRRRFTGHTLRVSGAQHMATAGLPLYLIQLQARWASD